MAQDFGFYGGPGLFFFVPLLSTAALFLIVLLVAVFLVRPAQPDRHGRRPYAVYLFSVVFVSVLTLLGAAGFLATALAETATDEAGPFGVTCPTPLAVREGIVRGVPPEQKPDGAAPPGAAGVSPVSPETEPFTDLPPPPDVVKRCFPEPSPGADVAPGAILAGLIGAAAAAVLLFHAREAGRLIAKEASSG